MFHPEKGFKDVVFEILRSDGKSISALSRELEERGYVIHRLILTGYLRALTDLNILKEKEVPPAKVYVPIKGKEKDVYEVIGERARQMVPPEEADELILFALSRICRRPIFADELKKAGLKGQPPGRQADAEERQEAKRVLARAGSKVPDSSIAYLSTKDMSAEYQEMLGSMLVDYLEMAYLVRETKQLRLDAESPEKK